MSSPDLPPPQPATQRLDAAVAAAAGVSRAHAQRLIAGGWVTVNGDLAVARDKGRFVTAADAVAVRAGFDTVKPQPDLPLAVVQRGPGWVVLDKPAGQHVHPLRPGETGTLLNAAAGRFAQLAGPQPVGREGGLRSGVVHRLDADTSGALVLALDAAWWDRLREGFAQHRVHKVYRALVAGHPPATGRADLPMAVTRHRRARVQVVDPAHPDARATGLSWRVLETAPRAARVQITLETGFLHQIRVALAHLGHPVLGDRAYGGAVADAAPRQMLHAWKLGGEGLGAECAECPEPEDMARAWRAMASG